jgi:hypothetical protein
MDAASIARLESLAYRCGRSYDSYLVMDLEREYFWSSGGRSPSHPPNQSPVPAGTFTVSRGASGFDRSTPSSTGRVLSAPSEMYLK